MKHVYAVCCNTALVTTCSYDKIASILSKAQNEDNYIQTLKALVEKNKSKKYFPGHNIAYCYENNRKLIMVPGCMKKLYYFQNS